MIRINEKDTTWLVGLHRVAGNLNPPILYVNAASFVNIGVNSHVMLYLAARSRKRFELNESVFSQQGKSAAQFVAILPMWILPIIIFALLDAAGVPYALYVFLGGAGILGLLLHRPILRCSTRVWRATVTQSRRDSARAGVSDGRKDHRQ